MKKVSLALACAALVSCGKKDNTSGPGVIAPIQQETKVENSKQDSDFDGISDKVEIENGMNPNIADLPSVTIESVNNIKLQSFYFGEREGENKSFNMIFSKNSRSKIQRLRSEAARMAYGDMYNLDEQLELTDLRDLNRQQLKCFTQAEFKKVRPLLINQTNGTEFSHLLMNLDIRTKFKKMKGLSEIVSPRFRIFLNEKNLKDFKLNRDIYNFRTQNYAFDDVQNINMIKDEKLEVIDFKEFHNCIETQALDFDYHLLGKELSYKKTLENVDKALAHIVIVQKGKLSQFSVNSKFYTFDKLLRELNAKPVYGHSGNLVSLFGKRNDFDSLESINIHDKRNLDKRKWFFINKESSTIVEKMTAGQVYFLANLSVHDLLKTEISKEVIINIHKSKLKIKNIYVGDKISMESNITGVLMVPPEKSYKIHGFFDSGGWKHGPVKNACQVHEYNNYINDTFIIESAERYKLKLNERDIVPEIVEDKLIYEFQVGFDEVKNFTIELQFPEQSKDRFPFKRMTNKRDVSKELDCVKQKGVSTNSTTFKNQSAFKKLKYRTSITRRGIHRN